MKNIQLRQLVIEAIEEAFENDNGLNEGEVENHCDDELKNYYLKLADNDEKAKKKYESMLKEFADDPRF